MKNLRLYAALLAVVVLGAVFLLFVSGEPPEPVPVADAAKPVPVQPKAQPAPIVAEAAGTPAPTPVPQPAPQTASQAAKSPQSGTSETPAFTPMGPDSLARIGALIQQQNDYRQSLGLNLLTPSPELQTEAEILIEQNIVRTCAPNVARKLLKGKQVSFVWEPALPRYSGPPAAQVLEPRYIVDMWKNGRRELGPDGQSCGGDDDCSSYLQMTRRAARTVGCAMAICPNQAQIWICRYEE